MILDKIFSIETNKKHKIYKLLGIKLKVKHKLDKKQYKLFMNNTVQSNTIAIIEINSCHWETMPGLCHYLLELGYNIDIITRYDAEKIFESLHNAKVSIFEFNMVTFDRIIKEYDFSKYDRIIYNSKRLYLKKNDINSEGLDISEYYDVVPKAKKDNIYIQHHIDKINDFFEPNQIILANPSHNPDLEKFVVNPHYFGEFKLKDHKNEDIVNFISIGELSKKRRNANLLISAVKDLHNSGFSNFKVTVIGRGEINEIAPEIQKYFDILGRVDYQTMFQKLNESDFILPLLDPEVESHKRYMDSGTSGTFQLVYGFNKPCIIHKTFADIYGFNEQNSIIYNNNERFVEAMQKVINITNDEYKSLQEALTKITKAIENNSIHNLQHILKEEK